jgi:hypothetical protein
MATLALSFRLLRGRSLAVQGLNLVFLAHKKGLLTLASCRRES